MGERGRRLAGTRAVTRSRGRLGRKAEAGSGVVAGKELEWEGRLAGTGVRG